MVPYLKNRIKSFNSKWMTGFIIVSVIAIMIVTSMIVGLSYKSITSLSTINLLSIRKNQELKRLDDLINRVQELHSNVRDFVLTRDSTYLHGTEKDKIVIVGLTKNFSDSLSPGKEKDAMLNLSGLIDRKITFNENILKLYQLGGRDLALEFIETGKASVLSDSIELVAGHIKEIESRAVEESVRRYDAAAQRTRLTIIIAGALIVFLGFVFMLTTVNNLQRRTATMNELEKASDAAEKAALLKSQFMSNMSHEIRTPLNSILGFTRLLSQSKLTMEQRDFVATIRNASEILLGIVNDVLDFSKIEAGMMRLERNEFNLDEILNHLRKLFEPGAKEKNLKLEIQRDPNIPSTCVGDSVRLNQVLVNLIGNAMKFTERGSITVRADLIELVDDRMVLEFRVKDTGVGIPDENLATIFDRFQQLDNNASRKYHGTGLGLSIVKSLVELEGGQIKVSSEVGKGTEFSFTIKYELKKNQASQPLPATFFKTPDDLYFLAGKVLLVEDNPLNQKLVSFIFKKWNIDYDLAMNGAIACDMVAKSSYELVLMDIQLPEMDGYEATAFIRKQLKSAVPVVALTAHALESEIHQFAEAGMNGYLTKPFKEEELYGVLFHFLRSELKTSAANGNAGKFTGEAPVIDFEELEKISGGNKLFVKELAETFMAQIQLEIKSLEEALLKKDLSTLSRTAHSMKSTVAYMGLTKYLEAQLNRMETAVKKNESVEPLRSDVEFTKQICLAAVKQLEAELPAYLV